MEATPNIVVMTRAEAEHLLDLADVTEDRTKGENNAVVALAEALGRDLGLMTRPTLLGTRVAL